MKTVRTLVLLNCAVLVFHLVFWGWARTVFWLEAVQRVTALDRAGVFDHERLVEYYPEFRDNMRYKLAAWLTRFATRSADVPSFTGAAVATANTIILFYVLRRSRRRSDASLVER